MGLSRLEAGAIEVARAGRFAAIPADRAVYALAGAASVAENLAARDVREGRLGSWAWLDRRAMRERARAAIAAFDVRGVRSLNQRAALLSGGNAQKLVLARELSDAPAVVLAHGPSRGLDVRAAAAVHARLTAERGKGAAVLLISDDLDEILALCDRIGVMMRGRIVAEFSAPADRGEIGRAMVGHA
jgi:simple sugar transport system ATP-binding protein